MRLLYHFIVRWDVLLLFSGPSFRQTIRIIKIDFLILSVVMIALINNVIKYDFSCFFILLHWIRLHFHFYLFKEFSLLTEFCCICHREIWTKQQSFPFGILVYDNLHLPRITCVTIIIKIAARKWLSGC